MLEVTTGQFWCPTKVNADQEYIHGQGKDYSKIGFQTKNHFVMGAHDAIIFDQKDKSY